jgi:outer membrane protein assembly factor BamB
MSARATARRTDDSDGRSPQNAREPCRILGFMRTSRLGRWLPAAFVPFATLLSTFALAQAAGALEFEDLEGWWSADPVHAGESSHIALQFLDDGKPLAKLSLPAIGAYDITLGTVVVSGNALDTQPLSFPLTYDAASATLRGYLPQDAVPIYRVPIEFRRGKPLVKPAPPQWQTARPDRKWSVQLGSAIWAGLAHDVSGNLLLAANDAGIVHAISEDGKVRWKFETGKPIKARPVVIGAHVYVSSDSGTLYKLALRDGAEAWRADIDAGSPPRIPVTEKETRWDRYGSAVVADAKRIYVASRDKNLYALDITNGKQIWKHTASDMMTATPALYRDLVVIADFAGSVQALAAADGKVRWNYAAKLAVPGDLAIAGDRVILGSRTYELIALDAATGREQWKHYYWFSWIESPPIVRDGTIYTGSSDATKVYAIDARSGALRWKTAVPGFAWARTAVNDRLVVAGTSGAGAYPGFRAGSLVALDRRSGAIRWIYIEPPSPAAVAANADWGFAASPLIVGNVVYAADLAGQVHAFTVE